MGGVIPRFPNGHIPDSALITFHTGWSQADKDYKWQLPPSTYRKHLALVARAKKRTGRTLSPSQGWSCNRPYRVQIYARQMYGNGAATPGTSSHGGFWEGKDTAAIDYGNWGDVYGWDRNAFYADCRAVGLTPGQIHPSRGNNYPDEPWHVIDLDPWAPVPAGVATGATTLPPLPKGKTMADVKQIHWMNGNKVGGRALIVPGTAWAVPFTESGSTYANRSAKQFDTGDSEEYTRSLFAAFLRAGERCAPTSVTVEIVDADA